MDTMRLTITFSTQESDPPPRAGVTAELRDVAGAPSSNWTEATRALADSYATHILGHEPLFRTAGLAREYLPKNGGEWQTVKTPAVYR